MLEQINTHNSIVANVTQHELRFTDPCLSPSNQIHIVCVICSAFQGYMMNSLEGLRNLENGENGKHTRDGASHVAFSEKIEGHRL